MVNNNPQTNQQPFFLRSKAGPTRAQMLQGILGWESWGGCRAGGVQGQSWCGN